MSNQDPLTPRVCEVALLRMRLNDFLAALPPSEDETVPEYHNRTQDAIKAACEGQRLFTQYDFGRYCGGMFKHPAPKKAVLPPGKPAGKPATTPAMALRPRPGKESK